MKRDFFIPQFYPQEFPLTALFFKYKHHFVWKCREGSLIGKAYNGTRFIFDRTFISGIILDCKFYYVLSVKGGLVIDYTFAYQTLEDLMKKGFYLIRMKDVNNYIKRDRGILRLNLTLSIDLSKESFGLFNICLQGKSVFYFLQRLSDYMRYYNETTPENLRNNYFLFSLFSPSGIPYYYPMIVKRLNFDREYLSAIEKRYNKIIDWYPLDYLKTPFLSLDEQSKKSILSMRRKECLKNIEEDRFEILEKYSDFEIDKAVKDHSYYDKVMFKILEKENKDKEEQNA